MNGTIDAGCGFMDIRYGSAFVQADSKYQGTRTLFTNTYTVAITDPIMNDTVSVLFGPFQAQARRDQDGLQSCGGRWQKSDVTTPAGMIYQIYSPHRLCRCQRQRFRFGPHMYQVDRLAQFSNSFVSISLF
jgi:hypothetical protein